VVLDPTLLLEKGEWLPLIGSNKKTKPVIVVYMLEYSENLLAFARSLSHRTGCPIRLLNKPYKHKVKEDYRTDVGPVEWLKEIQNAEYVVTNSFHGVAFSINFNKNFFVEIAEERIRGAMASRIENILKTFDLEERLIRTGIQADRVSGPLNINYDKINRRLLTLRADSVSYLARMLDQTDISCLEEA
jgi:hypothetical protein